MISKCARMIRAEIRAGRFSGPTSGLAAGYVQANIAILPAAHAAAFADFCAANQRACALLHRSEPGQYLLSALGADIDIRSDVPRYQIHRAGHKMQEAEDIRDYWRDDLVTFALGCSFSFEEALISAGLEVRNISEGRNVPMYRTAQPCTPAGPFGGNLVVSMRPFTPQAVERVCAITGRYPLVHGAPIYIGDADGLGIGDIHQPDFGQSVTIAENEIPVFWACGVTANEALRCAGLEYFITHAPGHMLIADLQNSALESITDIRDLHGN
ncbi:putative hydro-lyase [Microbulbifer pacificus]|uniref:Hydro-lyase n=1 Tax=Microbulbifer pacificus TaxID=407164 RepID=A0AAU0MY25_9GAMM|nr:putative hydro-lyase [Microbulbifer pacificus]WOX04724.1 putative hydro-lyase [Microbulbifer pacificus]